MTTDWTPETGYSPDTPVDSVPWRPYGAGKYFGLTLALDANVADYYCSSTASVGFKVYSPWLLLFYTNCF